MNEQISLIETDEHERCGRCHRKLKQPKARQLGYGATCHQKMQAEKAFLEKQKEANKNE